MYKTTNSQSRRRASHGPFSMPSSDDHGDQQLVAIAHGNVPIPAKCSTQLKRLLQEHSVNIPPPRILDPNAEEQISQFSQSPKDCQKDNIESDGGAAWEGNQPISMSNNSTVANDNTPMLSRAISIPPQANNDNRPIYPHLPYSPYGSPNTSPRVRRKPLRETNRVNSINDQSGEFVQLNQYKVEGAIGQVILI